MKLLTSIINRRRNGILSKKMYYLYKMIWWVYTTIWLYILFKIWYAWNVSLWFKIVINMLLIIGTPALSDLVKTYKKYEKEWEVEHVRRDNL